MEISFCSNQSCVKAIAMKFCTWQDNCAVMARAKFWSDIIPYNGVTLAPIFPQIWIMMEKSCVNGFSIFPRILFSIIDSIVHVSLQVENIRLLGIHLGVYARRTELHHLSCIEKSYTRTGLGGLWVSVVKYGINTLSPGPLFTKKTPFFHCRDSHYKPETVVRPS